MTSRSPVVNSLVGDRWRNDDNFPRGKGLLAHLPSVLLRNHGADIGLDSSSSYTHYDDSNNEDRQRSVRVLKRAGGCTANKNDVTSTDSIR